MAAALFGMNANAAPAMISEPNTNARRGRSIDTLYLDLDDLLDPDVAGELHADRHHQQDLPHAFAEQHVHVVRVDERERDRQNRWQRQEHVSGEPAVSRVDADLAKNLEPLTNDMREVLENLREVAARLALDENRGREEPDIQNGDAKRKVFERVLERQTKVLFVERLPELGADRFAQFVSRHLQAGCECMTRLERPGDQVQRLRKHFLERAQTPGTFELQEHERNGEADGRARRNTGRRSCEHRQDKREHGAEKHRHEQHATDADFHPRLLDPARERVATLGAADHAFESRQWTGAADLDERLIRGGRFFDRTREFFEPALQLALRHVFGQLRDADIHGHHQPDADDECRDQRQEQCHHRTSVTPSNMSAGRLIPDAFSRSHALGRTPVARKRPTTLPSWVTPAFSNRKISCIVMTSPSMPVISEMLTTLRVPSLMRVCWMTI